MHTCACLVHVTARCTQTITVHYRISRSVSTQYVPCPCPHPKAGRGLPRWQLRRARRLLDDAIDHETDRQGHHQIRHSLPSRLPKPWPSRPWEPLQTERSNSSSARVNTMPAFMQIRIYMVDSLIRNAALNYPQSDPARSSGKQRTWPAATADASAGCAAAPAHAVPMPRRKGGAAAHTSSYRVNGKRSQRRAVHPTYCTIALPAAPNIPCDALLVCRAHKMATVCLCSKPNTSIPPGLLQWQAQIVAQPRTEQRNSSPGPRPRQINLCRPAAISQGRSTVSNAGAARLATAAYYSIR